MAEIGARQYVSALNANLGYYAETGIDFEANYIADPDKWGLKGVGTLTANFVGTCIDSLTIEPLPGLGSIDCAGLA